jgi:hypothetical protein
MMAPIHPLTKTSAVSEDHKMAIMMGLPSAIPGRLNDDRNCVVLVQFGLVTL